MLLHLLSPLYYMIYVFFIQKIPPCRESTIMKSIRTYHNVFLSILSFIMLCLGLYSNYTHDKLNSFDKILCKSYNQQDYYINLTNILFYYSKYIEWLDTLFIHLSNKPITNLQYYHHLTTAIFTYLGGVFYIPSYSIVPLALNCTVHTFMYWYFAYPQGIMRPYRQYITKFQILQHVICIFVIIYTSLVDNCDINIHFNLFGISLYCMYLIHFLQFYYKAYIDKIK